MESNFEDYNLKLQTSILNPTKHAFALPTDIQFHKSIDRDFAEEIDSCSTKVLSITNRLLILAASSTVHLAGKGKAKLVMGQDCVVDDFDSVVVDIMDQLLERVVSELPQTCHTHWQLDFRTAVWTLFKALIRPP